MLQTKLFQMYQKGQGLVEYAVIVIIVVLVAITVGALFRNQISNLFTLLGSAIGAAPGT